MRLNVSVELTTTQFVLDDLAGDMALADLLPLLELESNVLRANMDLYVDDSAVDIFAPESASKTLEAAGLRDGSRVAIFNIMLAEGEMEAGARSELQTLRTQLASDPYQFSIIMQNNPEFAETIRSGPLASFARSVMRRQHAQKVEELRRVRRLAALQANPFDIEAQRAIEEEIQNENVETLRQEALEHMPESFGSVVMLYVNVRVNGVALKAFVDSGAQMTIMSQACAERCNISRLIDRRFQGLAVGVGSQKIVGRVHMYALELAGSHLPTSFSILENQPMDMLLGLDMLRRHQCVIDLQRGELLIGTTGTRTPFLSEQDLPDHARPRPAPEEAQGRAGAGGAASASSPASVAVSESALRELMALGAFTREQAAEALVVCGGDVQRAASFLLGS